MKTFVSSPARSCSLGLLALLALVSPGCVAKTELPTGALVLQTQNPQRPVVKEYKYVTRLGSHIPVRVPKHGQTTLAPGASPVSYVSGEVLRDLVLRPMPGR